MRGIGRVLALFAAVVLCSTASAADISRSVSFVTDPEKEGGFLIEVTRAAFQRVGYTVDVKYMPWVRALQTVSGGYAEALLGAYYTDARAVQMQYTDSIGTSEIVFFKLKTTDIHYARLEDLQPYTVGTIAGASYTPEFDDAASIRKEPVADYSTNIRKLLARRVPLIVEKRAVVLNTLMTAYPESADQVVALEKPLKVARFFNAFSKKIPGHEKKVADFNIGLEIIRQDGTLQKIMTRNLHE